MNGPRDAQATASGVADGALAEVRIHTSFRPVDEAVTKCRSTGGAAPGRFPGSVQCEVNHVTGLRRPTIAEAEVSDGGKDPRATSHDIQRD